MARSPYIKKDVTLNLIQGLPRLLWLFRNVNNNGGTWKIPDRDIRGKEISKGCHAELDSASSTHVVSQGKGNNPRGRSRIKYGMTANNNGKRPTWKIPDRDIRG